jgi:two-component system, OmpR family, response regulator
MERPANRLLIIDDDQALCGMLDEYLTAEGFAVDCCFDGSAGLDAARGANHDLVVLDVMLPGMTGLEVLRELRKVVQVPVLMLTARGEDIDRIVGLELGADDYVPKPCNPRELTARVRAILRRAGQSSADGQLKSGNLELLPAERSARLDGEELRLTSMEFEVLSVLVAHAGRIVSREELSAAAQGRELGRYDRSLDVHVSNLRSKLGPAEDGEPRIQAVRGKGYIYRVISGGAD